MTSAQVKKRRERISLCLSKSITSSLLIAQELGLKISTVSNDLHWMKKNSMKWLAGHTLDGYVFETQNAIEQLRDMELELQSKRNPNNSLDDVIKIIHELKELINMRWVMQGDGPTLMNARKIQELNEK